MDEALPPTCRGNIWRLLTVHESLSEWQESQDFSLDAPNIQSVLL
jgi:hypothetical protein